jgi:hypothetical protein
VVIATGHDAADARRGGNGDVAQLDAKMAAGRGSTVHDSRRYIAWSNTLLRTLKQPGLQPAKAPPRRLQCGYSSRDIHAGRPAIMAGRPHRGNARHSAAPV